MQFGPDAGAGAKGEQAHGLAAITEGHHEQSCAPIFPAFGIADHGASTVIDLRLFPWCRENHCSSFDRLISLQLADEAFDTAIGSAESMVGY